MSNKIKDFSYYITINFNIGSNRLNDSISEIKYYTVTVVLIFLENYS